MAPRKGTKPWNAGKGNGWITQRGYRAINIDGRQVKEHRYIMERLLGRSLLPEEDVHQQAAAALGMQITPNKPVSLVIDNTNHAEAGPR